MLRLWLQLHHGGAVAVAVPGGWVLRRWQLLRALPLPRGLALLLLAGHGRGHRRRRVG